MQEPSGLPEPVAARTAVSSLHPEYLLFKALPSRVLWKVLTLSRSSRARGCDKRISICHG